jgi:hypothetical protein
MSRFDSIESPITTLIRIKRDGAWYQMRPLLEPLERVKRIVGRLRRKGREVKFTYFEGMG